jgi:hypothetical protein
VKTTGFASFKTLALVAVLGAAGVPVWAEDAPAAPSIDVTGFVDGFYSYNFNDPADRKNTLHVFDVDHNSFELALVEVAFEKKPAAGSPVGFRLDLDFGPAADISNSFDPQPTEISKHIQQGYVSWLASPKLQFDFGKFVTPVGAEVVEAKDNWNYTRSIQFGYAIPIYHSGLRATLTPSDKFTLAAYLVNGWNNVLDQNDDKTFGAQVVLKPSSKFTWYNNAFVGKEAKEGGDTRTLYDTVLSLTASDKFSLMSEFDYGKEGDATWTAVSGYAKWQAGPNVAFSPRVEYFDDSDGWALIGTKVMSYTLTTELKLGGGVLAKIDLRGDHADEPLFDGDKSQTGVTLGVIYAFGGKI